MWSPSLRPLLALLPFPSSNPELQPFRPFVLPLLKPFLRTNGNYEFAFTEFGEMEGGPVEKKSVMREASSLHAFT